ncbi:MAG: glycosyltransferase family 4 protein [Candidatus Kryptonium sp.]
MSFIGNLSYFPNADAVYFFTREILPQILKEEPEARFYVVGQNPTKKMKKMSSEKIIITGFVNEIKYEYLKSAVVVAPIRFGAGMQNKIVEALALGIPVVATSVAVNGLPGELKDLVFVSDDPKEFAKNVVAVIRDPNIRKQVQIRRYIVKDTLSLEVIGQKLENYLKELLTIKVKTNEIKS